ncbi:MAG: ATP-binding protein [Saprospiraceae bacterium]
MSLQESPFKFLDSYQQADHEVFFGREKETKDLYNAMSGVKVLLVYGPSGSGKTSLIECGLRNQFSDADWYALTIRRGSDINASVFSFINRALSQKIDINPITKMPVDSKMEFSQAVENLFAERYQPIYLLFDQFEELLISGDTEEKKKFFTLLNKLILNKVPCRVIIIMREEFIGHLSEFESLCPSIFQHRFRVEKMGRNNVKDVLDHILTAPAYQQYFKVEESQVFAESILSKLPDKSKQIELAHVQVYLRELWDRAQSNKKNVSDIPVLNKSLIYDDDNLESVLESFLKKQIQQLEGNYGARVPLEVLAAMITDRSTKLQISADSLIKDLEQKKVISKKPILDLLNDLEQRRIIRTIKVGDETQYEISHDVLALVVGQNRTDEMKMREKAGDIYKVYSERKGLFTQDDIDYLRPFMPSLAYPSDLQIRIDQSISTIKKGREEQLLKTRKRLRVVYSLLGGAIIAFISAGYFGYQADSAKKGMKEQLEKNEEFLAKSVGKKFQGGIIFYSDSSRTHGLVAAYSDFDSTYNWKAAMKICEDYVFIEDGVEYRDWFLPSKDTLGMLRVFRDEVGGFSEAVYWSSSLDQFKNAFELNFEDGFPLRREDSVLRKVRAVHSF